MRLDDVDDLEARKAATVLLRAYRRQRVKSWAKVAARYGLANKARAYRIAHGTLRPTRAKDGELLRAVLRESDAVRAPKKTLRLIRKLAVPFLANRRRSRRRIYGRNGQPL